MLMWLGYSSWGPATVMCLQHLPNTAIVLDLPHCQYQCACGCRMQGHSSFGQAFQIFSLTNAWPMSACAKLSDLPADLSLSFLIPLKALGDISRKQLPEAGLFIAGLGNLETSGWCSSLQRFVVPAHANTATLTWLQHSSIRVVQKSYVDCKGDNLSSKSRPAEPGSLSPVQAGQQPCSKPCFPSTHVPEL